jgi:hypothetical protein
VSWALGTHVLGDDTFTQRWHALYGGDVPPCLYQVGSYALVVGLLGSGTARFSSTSLNHRALLL